MTCPCGGWGVQCPYTYQVSPCPKCHYGNAVLHHAYDEVLKEPLPDWADELLAKLK